MLLRQDRTEKVIRNVHEDIPGTLCVGQTADNTVVWLIDASYQPKPVDFDGTGGVLVENEVTDTGLGPMSTIVDVDDVVEACETPEELHDLLAYSVAVFTTTCGRAVPHLGWEDIEAAVSFARRTRDAVFRLRGAEVRNA